MKDQASPDNDLLGWLGLSHTNFDTIDARPARLMRTIFEGAQEFETGDPLPPLWHWLYFPTSAPLRNLGRDGHPKFGGFVPPLDLPRRMWAGGRFEFTGPLRIGDRVEKRSVIKKTALKEGHSGRLCFVTVRHEFFVSRNRRLTEEHDIVYRESPRSDSPTPALPDAPKDCHSRRLIEPSSLMLFRYSALTYNAHRIHFDRDYCRNTEGYPGLVIHGPLTATFLIDLALQRNSGRALRSYEFKAVSPLFDTEPFTIGIHVDGDTSVLWAATPQEKIAMHAEASFF